MLMKWPGDSVSGTRTDRGGVCAQDERSMSIDGICLRSIMDTTTTWKLINTVVRETRTAQSSARWMQEDQNRMAGLVWCESCERPEWGDGPVTGGGGVCEEEEDGPR